MVKLIWREIVAYIAIIIPISLIGFAYLLLSSAINIENFTRFLILIFLSCEYICFMISTYHKKLKNNGTIESRELLAKYIATFVVSICMTCFSAIIFKFVFLMFERVEIVFYPLIFLILVLFFSSIAIVVLFGGQKFSRNTMFGLLFLLLIIIYHFLIDENMILINEACGKGLFFVLLTLFVIFLFSIYYTIKIHKPLSKR